MSSNFETNRLLKASQNRIISKLCELGSDSSSGATAYCDIDGNISAFLLLEYDSDTGTYNVRWVDTSGNELESQPEDTQVCSGLPLTSCAFSGLPCTNEVIYTDNTTGWGPNDMTFTGFTFGDCSHIWEVDLPTVTADLVEDFLNGNSPSLNVETEYMTIPVTPIGFGEFTEITFTIPRWMVQQFGRVADTITINFNVNNQIECDVPDEVQAWLDFIRTNATLNNGVCGGMGVGPFTGVYVSTGTDITISNTALGGQLSLQDSVRITNCRNIETEVVCSDTYSGGSVKMVTFLDGEGTPLVTTFYDPITDVELTSEQVGTIIPCQEYYTSIVQTKTVDQDFGTILGRVSEIAASGTDLDICSEEATYTGHPIGNSAEQMQLVSTDGGDTMTIRVHGLDTNYDYQTEDIALNGGFPVFTTATFRRVFKLENMGSVDCAGTVNCVDSVLISTTYARINAEDNISFEGVYTVPRNKTMYINSIYISAGTEDATDTSVEARLRVREVGGVYKSIRTFHIANDAPYNPQLKNPIKIGERADVKFTIDDISDNDTSVTLEADFILKDEIA